MKRGRKSANSNGNAKKGSDLVKSTILLDKNLKQHLALAALVTGQEQSEIMRDALKERLSKMGCELSEPPQLPNLKRLPRPSMLLQEQNA